MLLISQSKDPELYTKRLQFVYVSGMIFNLGVSVTSCTCALLNVPGFIGLTSDILTALNLVLACGLLIDGLRRIYSVL